MTSFRLPVRGEPILTACSMRLPALSGMLRGQEIGQKPGIERKKSAILEESMNKNLQSNHHKKVDLGVFIALGAGFGASFGLLIMDGNVGLGISTGIIAGLILGSIAERRQPFYPLAGIAAGGAGGALLGALASLRVPGSTLVGAVIGGSFGFAVGTILAALKERQGS